MLLGIIAENWRPIWLNHRPLPLRSHKVSDSSGRVILVVTVQKLLCPKGIGYSPTLGGERERGQSQPLV